MPPLLELSELHAGYEETPVLRDVSLEIESRAIVSLLGRNGAGKTTLMKAAMGILDLTRGTIEFSGTDITRFSPHERARRGMGYVPQDRGLFPQLTVEENLRMGLGVNQAREGLSFNQIFEYFPRLEERLTQRAETLSGGEQQMLAIGRALVGGPDLLLLDEVSEGVQPTIIEAISDVLIRINDDLDTAIFIAEQNLDLVSGLGSRSYVLQKGNVVASFSDEEFNQAHIASEYLGL